MVRATSPSEVLQPPSQHTVEAEPILTHIGCGYNPNEPRARLQSVCGNEKFSVSTTMRFAAQFSIFGSRGKARTSHAPPCANSCRLLHSGDLVESANRRKSFDTRMPPQGLETTPENKGETAYSAESGAKSGAIFGETAPFDSDLQALIDRWPALSADVKARIMALAIGDGE